MLDVHLTITVDMIVVVQTVQVHLALAVLHALLVHRVLVVRVVHLVVADVAVNIMDENIRLQLYNVFSDKFVKTEKQAIVAAKEAFNDSELFILPPEELIRIEFNVWSKKVDLKKANELIDDMFDSYNDALEDVVQLIRKTKPKKEELNKEELILKIEKLKR